MSLLSFFFCQTHKKNHHRRISLNYLMSQQECLIRLFPAHICKVKSLRSPWCPQSCNNLLRTRLPAGFLFFSGHSRNIESRNNSRCFSLPLFQRSPADVWCAPSVTLLIKRVKMWRAWRSFIFLCAKFNLNKDKVLKFIPPVKDFYLFILSFFSLHCWRIWSLAYRKDWLQGKGKCQDNDKI